MVSFELCRTRSHDYDFYVYLYGYLFGFSGGMRYVILYDLNLLQCEIRCTHGKF